jgi:hypothetical protein
VLYIGITAVRITEEGGVVAAKVIRLRPGKPVLPGDGAPAAISLLSRSIRSVERRRWSADLVRSELAGLVVHGVGGIGKSMLAAEIAARVGRLEPERTTTIISGEVSVDTFLAGLAAAVRRHPGVISQSRVQAEAVKAAERTDLPWAQRLALLREHVLGQIPVLVVLDNFDDSLTAESGRGGCP